METFEITPQAIYRAFQLQFTRKDLGMGSVRALLLDTDRSHLATPLMYHTLFKDGIVALALEAFVSWSTKDRYCGEFYKEGLLTCVVSQNKLATQLTVSRSTIARSIKRLRQLGIVKYIGRVQMDNKAVLPVMCLGEWHSHPRTGARVVVWYLDIAAGSYNNEKERQLIEQLQQMVAEQANYSEISLFDGRPEL